MLSRVAPAVLLLAAGASAFQTLLARSQPQAPARSIVMKELDPLLYPPAPPPGAPPPPPFGFDAKAFYGAASATYEKKGAAKKPQQKKPQQKKPQQKSQARQQKTDMKQLLYGGGSAEPAEAASGGIGAVVPAVGALIVGLIVFGALGNN